MTPAAAVLLLTAAAACHPAQPADPAPAQATASTSQAPITASPAPAPTAVDGRVKVPSADPTSAEEVAEAFVIAYWSYDARVETAHSRLQRVRPFATPAFIDREQNARMPEAERERARQADELVQITGTQAYRDPSAPEPTSRSALLVVSSNRTVTTSDGVDTDRAPTHALTLVSDGTSWLVDGFVG